jgi:PTS system galactitol-specific IIA component
MQSRPHTDPQFVKKNAVSVGVLEEPIEMVVMGTSDEPVSVSIIFLLSLAQSNKQLNILKRIMSVVQDQNELRRFISATNEEIAIDVQKAILEGLE